MITFSLSAWVNR